MSVIDLKTRKSQDWGEMHQHLQSPDSKIYVKPILDNNVCPTSMDLEVGDAYILPGSNQTFRIPPEGLKVKPKTSVVVHTNQRLKLPYNVFGVVTGKGIFIYKGCFLATGKIDPAFDGHLKIGFFNGSNSEILLKKGERFATVYFLNTDATLASPLNNYQTNPEPSYPKLKWYYKMWYWIKDNWKMIITWLIASIVPILKLVEMLKIS